MTSSRTKLSTDVGADMEKMQHAACMLIRSCGYVWNFIIPLQTRRHTFSLRNDHRYAGRKKRRLRSSQELAGWRQEVVWDGFKSDYCRKWVWFPLFRRRMIDEGLRLGAAAHRCLSLPSSLATGRGVFLCSGSASSNHS